MPVPKMLPYKYSPRLRSATLIIDGEHEVLNGLTELLFVSEANDR
jgi:hypothetical protein